MADHAPASDLGAAVAVLDADVRRELIVRWVDRVVRELAPTALQRLEHDDAARELLAIAENGVQLDDSESLYEIANELYLRTWPKQASDEAVAHFVLECVKSCASALGHEAGTMTTVRAEWSEEDHAIGAEVPYTPEEVIEHARWRMIETGAAARTMAHILDGERGFRDEVGRQYRELERATGGNVNLAGDDWGTLEAGNRYRVYSAFVDLDGCQHPWGESWLFEGFRFAPATCEVTLRVAQAIQLDRVGAPSHPIDVRPFRLALAVGDRRGHPLDPVRTLFTVA
ncbi:MAG TPA: hypothetical protein VIV11_38750 [Kofleriaceae bacterium]